MNEEFDLPVLFDNKQYHFKARLLVLGAYTHKIQVDVNGTNVLYEMDEERNYRAWIDPETKNAFGKPTKELLQAIAESLKSILL